MITNLFCLRTRINYCNDVNSDNLTLRDGILRKHSPEKLPDFSCAYGCSNKRTVNCQLSFYRIPFGVDKESLELRQKWVNAIKRENWSEKQTDNARICSAHFITGKCS